MRTMDDPNRAPGHNTFGRVTTEGVFKIILFIASMMRPSSSETGSRYVFLEPCAEYIYRSIRTIVQRAEKLQIQLPKALLQTLPTLWSIGVATDNTVGSSKLGRIDTIVNKYAVEHQRETERKIGETSLWDFFGLMGVYRAGLCCANIGCGSLLFPFRCDIPTNRTER